MSVERELRRFDGKHVDALEAFAARHEPTPGRVAELVELAGRDDEQLQVTATWVLKRYAEEKRGYGRSDATRIGELFSRVSAWEAKLHLLQLLPRLELSEKDVEAIFDFGLRHLDHANKFVRAWSYGALAEIADEVPSRRREVLVHFARAQTSQPASVKARIRQLRKQFDWLVEA